MDELLRFALVTLTAMLFIVDPIAVVPTYLVITQDETVAERRSTAFRACVAMTILLLVFAATGTALFSVPSASPSRRSGRPGDSSSGSWRWTCCAASGAPRRAGTRSWRDRPRRTWRSPRSPSRCSRVRGAISTVIVLAAEAKGAAHTAIVYGAIVLTGVLSYLTLRLGEPLLGRLGKTGIKVVTRVMGLLLAAVAVQFVLSGVKEAFGL